MLNVDDASHFISLFISFANRCWHLWLLYLSHSSGVKKFFELPYILAYKSQNLRQNIDL